MWALHRRGLDHAGQAVVPAVVLGQAWRGGPQPQLARLLRGCVIEPFDENDGRAVGCLLRDTGTSDVVDAHVVLTALRVTDAGGSSTKPLSPIDPRSIPWSRVRDKISLGGTLPATCRSWAG